MKVTVALKLTHDGKYPSVVIDDAYDVILTEQNEYLVQAQTSVLARFPIQNVLYILTDKEEAAAEPEPAVILTT